MPEVTVGEEGGVATPNIQTDTMGVVPSMPGSENHSPIEFLARAQAPSLKTGLQADKGTLAATT